MIWSRFFPDPADLWKSSQPLPPNKGEVGEEARKLLDNPVLHEALDRVERRLVETWRTSPIGDGEGREATYRLHWAVEELKAELRRMIGNASMNARERQ